jgi:hypothetical protein
MYDNIANSLIKKDPKLDRNEKNPKSVLSILGTGLDCSRLTKSIVNNTEIKYKELFFIVSNNDLSRVNLGKSHLIEDLTKKITVRDRKAKYIKGGIFFVSEVVFFFDVYENSIDAKNIKRIVILDRTSIDKNDPLSAAITLVMINNPVSFCLKFKINIFTLN